MMAWILSLTISSISGMAVGYEGYDGYAVNSGVLGGDGIYVSYSDYRGYGKGDYNSGYGNGRFGTGNYGNGGHIQGVFGNAGYGNGGFGSEYDHSSFGNGY